MTKRTPEEIVGKDALIQLIFEGYQVAPDDDIQRVIQEDGNWWQPCSGCHETNEGQETGYYPYSKAYQCHVGSGCRECGGIGVYWNYHSEEDLAALDADTWTIADRIEAGDLKGDEPCDCGECTVVECNDCMVPKPSVGGREQAIASKFSSMVREYRANSDNDHGARMREDMEIFLMDNLCEIEELLSSSTAALSQNSAEAWQPIETAPKDGTHFWGLCDENAISMWWCTRFEVFTSSSFQSVEMYSDPFLAMHKHRPTHWMMPISLPQSSGAAE